MMMNRNETRQQLQRGAGGGWIALGFAKFHRIHPRLTSSRVSREKSRKHDVSFLESNLASRLSPDDHVKVLAMRWFRAEEKEPPYVICVKKEYFEVLLFSFEVKTDTDPKRTWRLCQVCRGKTSRASHKRHTSSFRKTRVEPQECTSRMNFRVTIFRKYNWTILRYSVLSILVIKLQINISLT